MFEKCGAKWRKSLAAIHFVILNVSIWKFHSSNYSHPFWQVSQILFRRAIVAICFSKGDFQKKLLSPILFRSTYFSLKFLSEYCSFLGITFFRRRYFRHQPLSKAMHFFKTPLSAVHSLKQRVNLSMKLHSYRNNMY